MHGPTRVVWADLTVTPFSPAAVVLDLDNRISSTGTERKAANAQTGATLATGGAVS